MRRLDNPTMSPILVEMLLAAEDHRYFKHPGIDPLAIIRASYKTIIRRKREGGSTIAMQLVRVATGRYERTLARKITEMYLALKLTRKFGKRKIPEIYLKIAYFGSEMIGIEQAATKLNVDPSKLSEIDAARLIARLKYPEPKYEKFQRLQEIEGRANYIINRHRALFNKFNSH